MADNNIFKLEAESELQIRVCEQNENTKVELLEGMAEIFGTEMQRNKEYSLPPATSVSVFTWHGCSILLTGAPAKTHVANETLMILHVSLHACLEDMRIKAEKENCLGPVALIVGPTDSGKSTLCRTLLNYATRLGRRPFLVDLDVGQNSLSIPGTVNVLNVQKPADIVEGFDQEAIQAYQFGYKSPGQLIALYFLLIKRLGQTMQTRLKQTTNSNARSSGVIINTCGWIRGQGYNAITLAALHFEIDKLVVLGEDRLYTQLKRDMPSCVEVIFMPKMCGVVERSKQLRSRSRQNRVKEYFYGTSIPLQPHTFEIIYSEFTIYKIEMKYNDPDVVTADVVVDDIYFVDMPLGNHLINRVLALSAVDEPTKDMALSNIIGFICVMDIDKTKGTMKVLSPQPAPLPKNILFMGEIELIDRFYMQSSN